MPSLQKENDNNWQDEMRTISDSLKYLFNNRQMSDVKFIFKNELPELESKIIYAHTLILSMMSSNFHNSFQSNLEICKEIIITEHSYETFLEFLNFIYTNELYLDSENQFNLLKVAEEYSVKSLIEECIEFISRTLTKESACLILTKFITSGLNGLKEKIIYFIGQNMREVLQAETFLNINENSLKEIFTIEETGPITEFEIFSATMQWASKKCLSYQMEINGENKRNVLGDLSKLIRFPIMAYEELIQCLEDEDGFFTFEEKSTILSTISAKGLSNFGFINEPRKHSEYLNGIDEIFFQIYENQEWSNDNKYNTISNGRTKFVVNKPVYLTETAACISTDCQNGTIEILDDENIIISEEKYRIDNDPYKRWANLKKPVLLKPNHEYILNIYYENTNTDFYCVDKKSLPWSKTVNEVEFKFYDLSQSFRWLRFKPFY